MKGKLNITMPLTFKVNGCHVYEKYTEGNSKLEGLVLLLALIVLVFSTEKLSAGVIAQTCLVPCFAITLSEICTVVMAVASTL